MITDPTTSGRATSTKSAFARATTIAIVINAPRQTVWALLTDAAGFPRWNSTVTKIEGTIAAGEKLRISVPISKRTFTPRVLDFDPPQSMVWRDGAKPMFWGIRDYTLTAPSSSTTKFTMTETIRGLMLPLAGRSLPDFGPVFERYAADLKTAAEAHAKG